MKAIFPASAAVIALFAGLALSACDDKAMEKTGEKMDNAVDNDDHTLERAGEEADEAVHDKDDKADDTLDDTRDKLEGNK